MLGKLSGLTPPGGQRCFRCLVEASRPSLTPLLQTGVPPNTPGMNASTCTVQGRDPDSKRSLLSNGVLAMILLVIIQTMLLAGLISAHIAFVADQIGEVWPPLDQPRLPVARTATTTAALVLSGIILALSNLQLRADPRRALTLLGVVTLLGGFFVVSQGVEGLGLVQAGLRVRSSTYGAFFYLIVGTHTLNALVALCVLAWAWGRLRRGALPASQFLAVQIFWYFVVLTWPVIYFQVYQ